MKPVSLSPQTVEKCCQAISAADARRPLLVGVTGEARAEKAHFFRTWSKTIEAFR